MRVWIRNLLCIAIVAIVTASHAITFRDAGNGDLEVATTSTLVLLHHGQIVRLSNLLTKEDLATPASGMAEPTTFLMNETGESDAVSTDTLSSVEIGPVQAIQRTRFSSGSSISTTAIAGSNGDIQLRQDSACSRKGLESVGLGLPSLASETKVLIPTGTGLCLDERFTGTRDFAWPSDWRVQMAFIQGKSGGVLVRAADPSFQQFKTLRVQHESTSTTLGLSLISPVTQPVTNVSQSASVMWSFRAGKESWREVAEAERVRLLPQLDLLKGQHVRRSWMENIRLIVTPFRMRQVVSGPMDLQRHKDFIEALRKRVNPETTLINYVYDWRKEERETGEPGQEINQSAKAAAEYARQQGFRIMVSMDIRCDLRHPLYPQVRRAHMRYGMPQSPPYG